MLRRDLAAAGIAYRDAAGRVFDFHALRHQFISTLAAAGVHPKTAQTLARHKSIRLTMDRYTHLSPSGAASALENLPELPWPATEEREKSGASVALWEEKPVPREAATGHEARAFSGSPETTKALASKGFGGGLEGAKTERGRRDSNPQPPDRQSGTLTN